jgi:putative addiction module killer protein
MKTIFTTNTFDSWFSGLKDNHAKRRIQMRIDRAEDGNFGDTKPVGEGVSEMRVNVGAGYRVYYMQKGNGYEIIILLAGGDKSTQQQDIRTAIELARDIKGEQ